MLLETVLKFADSYRLSEQEAALKAVERLCEKRCTKALTYIMKEFAGSYRSFQQQLYEKARDCL